MDQDRRPGRAPDERVPDEASEADRPIASSPPPFDRYDHRGSRASEPFAEQDGSGGRGSGGWGGARVGRGRSRAAAVALALFLGGLGIHKFYLGRVWQGLLYLFFFWTAVPAIASWIEAVLLLNMDDATFARRYGGSGAPANRTAIGCLWLLALAPIVATALYLLLGGEPGGLMVNPLSV